MAQKEQLAYRVPPQLRPGLGSLATRQPSTFSHHHLILSFVLDGPTRPYTASRSYQRCSGGCTGRTTTHHQQCAECVCAVWLVLHRGRQRRRDRDAELARHAAGRNTRTGNVHHARLGLHLVARCCRCQLGIRSTWWEWRCKLGGATHGDYFGEGTRYKHRCRFSCFVVRINGPR